MKADEQRRLREQAERLLPSPGNIPESRPEWALLHELQVHQIELEMQNEELRTAHHALEESRDRYVDLYEFAPVAYLSVDRKGVIQSLNLTGANLLGMDRADIVLRPFLGFVSGPHRDRFTRYLARLSGNPLGTRLTVEVNLAQSNGVIRSFQIDGTMPTGSEPQFRLGLTDLTSIKESEADLRIAATAFESHEAIVVTDSRGRVVKSNVAFTRITGYHGLEVRGKTLRGLRSKRHPVGFYAGLFRQIREAGTWADEVWILKKGGEVFPIRLCVTAVKDPLETVSHYVLSITDLSESKKATERIAQLAFYDPLTQLPNRQLLLDRLRHALTTHHRQGEEGALLFLDLDQFKTLNDSLGHDTGDELLKQVANRLLNCVRAGDTVSRFGGDEFMVMLEGLGMDPHAAATRVESVGEKIRLTLNETYPIGSHAHHISPSIGATLFSDRGKTAEDLLKQADLAMYQAKKGGRNTLRFFNPLMQAQMDARWVLEESLHHALTAQQFKLFYQPQVDDAGVLVGAETLIRWQHPHLGLVPPLDFIPLAEETGMIRPIGAWVLGKACAQLKAWKGDPRTAGLHLSVNVSASQLHDPGFLDQVSRQVQENSIAPGRLVLELTEAMALVDVEKSVETMDAISRLGVRFSLDDFGTGFSSLSYLTRLPLHQLKIDRSFVSQIGRNHRDSIIAQTIIGMAKNLDLTVIAEGVETVAQRDALLVLGCPLFQGFLYGKGVDLEEFERNL